ncbi:hypothetical protein YC2023_017125 [Brassica napus]
MLHHHTSSIDLVQCWDRGNTTIRHRHTRSTTHRSHLTTKITGRDLPPRCKARQAKSPSPEQRTPEDRNRENPVNLNPKSRPLPRTTAQPPHREARTATTPPESYLLAREEIIQSKGKSSSANISTKIGRATKQRQKRARKEKKVDLRCQYARARAPEAGAISNLDIRAHGGHAHKISVLVWCAVLHCQFIIRSIPKSYAQSGTNFEKVLGRLLEDFSGNLLMHFMLEDFPRSILKSSAQNMCQTLENFSENSWKTLRRLFEDFLGSLLMYFMLEAFPRSFRKVFQSLLPKVVQRNDVKWSPSLSIKQNNSDSPVSFINFTTTTINYPIQHKLRPRQQNQSNILLIIMIISVIVFITSLFLFTPPEETKDFTSTKGLKVVSIILQE